MNTPQASPASCDRQAELVAYLYGEASPTEIASFERHLQTCAVCRAELEGLQSVRKALQSWEMDAIAPRLQLVIRPTWWQAWREFFALLPRWGKLATGAAAIVLVLSLANLRITVGAQGVSLSVGWLTAPELVQTPQPPAAVPSVPHQTAPAAAVDEAVIRQVTAHVVTEMLATQAQARDAELEARMNARLEARLKQQRAELVRLVGQLNRAQQLQLAAWIRDSELRSSPDLLDLVSTFSATDTAAEGDD